MPFELKIGQEYECTVVQLVDGGKMTCVFRQKFSGFGEHGEMLFSSDGNSFGNESCADIIFNFK